MKPRFFRHYEGFVGDIAYVMYEPSKPAPDDLTCVRFDGTTCACYPTVGQVLKAHHNGTYLELSEEEAKALLDRT